MRALLPLLFAGCLPHFPEVDRSVALGPTDSGGWEEEGAGLGWAVDEAGDRALVVALRFDVAAFEAHLEPLADPATTAGGYAAAESPVPTPTDRWPALADAFTDADGVAAMPAPLTAVLMEGLDAPEVWVAVGGDVRLARESDRDELDAHLVFEQVSGLGPGAVAEGGELVALEPLTLAWGVATQE